MLFRIRTNGTGLHQITKAGTAAEDPAFAPDGRRVAFSRAGIFTVKLDGSGLRRLTRHPEDAFPAYSPNGKRIAFIRNFRVYVMQTNGRALHVLRRAPRAMGPPSWSPDGKSIILSGGQNGPEILLYTLDARTGRVEKRTALEENTLADVNPFAMLSPNGRTVAFLDRRPPPPNCEGDACNVFALYRKPASGGSERRVCNCGPASWSADSRVLLYENARRQLELRVIRDGRRRTITIPADKTDLRSRPAGLATLSSARGVG